jgi:hypothetical protein
VLHTSGSAVAYQRIHSFSNRFSSLSPSHIIDLGLRFASPKELKSCERFTTSDFLHHFLHPRNLYNRHVIVVNTISQTMIAATRKWFRRYRTPFAIGFGVVGVGYVATQYVLGKISDARERMSSDRIAREK